MDIRALLENNRDEAYKSFMAPLCPTVNADRMLGVRTPVLKGIAKKMIKQGDAISFLASLPHKYFEEDQLHAFIINEIKDAEAAVMEVERFLPFIDNWATCDQLIPKAFKKSPDKLLPYIEKWIASGEIYTVRFAIGLLMRHFIDRRFDMHYPLMVANVHSGEYYVNMMSAWYFATALIKRYHEVLPFFTEHRLEKWVHNKAISKARDSFRLPGERKDFLKGLRR